MSEKLLENVCNDSEFLKSVLEMENNEDIKKAFLSKGIEMSDDDVVMFKTDVINTINNDIKIDDCVANNCNKNPSSSVNGINNENKMPDSILEKVSGGKSSWIGKNWQKLVYATSAVAVAGTAIWAVKTLTDKASGTIDEGRGLMKKAGGTLDNVDNLAGNAENLINKANPVVDKIDKAATDVGAVAEKINRKGIWSAI